MENKAPQINIIIPLFNEEEVFAELIKRIDSVCHRSNLQIEIILVDDGSSDATPALMRKLSKDNQDYTSVFLSRNFGHQFALSAGLSCVNASEAVFILDGDLQDPPELLEIFYNKITEGYDVAYAIRTERKENFIKKGLYKIFYRLLKRIAYIELPLDSGDFSMLSRRVVNQLNKMPEQSRFLRGMRSWIGYKQIGIPYKRDERSFGDSKYSTSALFKLAFNGIFNFSEYPIKIVTRIGLITFLMAGIYLFITLIKKYFFGSVPEGFTGVIALIILFGGAQLFAIGLIGEYVLRIFFQVKQRPLYIIDEIFRKNKSSNQ